MKPVTNQMKQRFVLHEHWASHHHFDFRLERRGVLKSWALPKGVPVYIGNRRLAVETENHPMEWLTFQGKIPEGEYGGGTVKIKDHGHYQQLFWSPEKIEVILEGKLLKGKFVLIPYRKEKRQWLMIKARKSA